MINEERTLKDFGYISNILKPKSSKKVWSICEECGKERLLAYKDYRNLCLSCSHSNKNHPLYGKHRSEETKQKISKSNTGKNIGNANAFYGKKHSNEVKAKMSKAKEGKYYGKDNPNWKGGITNSPYCPLFNEKCKESNRDKYNRKCFICGLPEEKNITSTNKHQKLSVHHIDMNKQQGCNGYEWKLIPVCLHCHNTLHNKRMMSCLIYIISNKSS